MPRALDVLQKAAPRRIAERRIGNKPGDVRARSVIRGRSYDHVRTPSPGVFELHPSNVERPLGRIVEHGGRHRAVHGIEDLGTHPDHHKAARAIVDFHGPHGGIAGGGTTPVPEGFGDRSDDLREGDYG